MLNFATDKVRTLVREFTYVKATLRLVWKSSRRWTQAWIALLILQGLIPLAIVHLSKGIVDSLVVAMEAPSWENGSPVLIYGLAFGLIFLLGEISSSVLEYVRRVQAEIVRDDISGRVHRHCSSLDLTYYESPEYLDKLHRVTRQGGERTLAVLESTGSLMQNTLTLLALATALLPYAWWLPLALVGSSLPVFLVMVKHSQRYHRWWEKSTQNRRWTDYYNFMLTERHPASELRMFSLGEHFSSSYQKTRLQLRTEELSLIRRQALGRLFASLFGLGITGAVLAWCLWSMLSQQDGATAAAALGLGDLMLFQQAFTRGQGGMRALLSDLNQLYKNMLHLRNLFEFFALTPKIKDGPQALPATRKIEQGVSLKNINFRYPGSHRKTLENFNLEIPAGKLVAIVGANGAGKSTLIKLLLRFYDPEEGQLQLDGTNIKEFAIDDLRRLVTVLFQAPVSYQASATHNILIGDRQRKPDQAAVQTAAELAGAAEVIDKLPEGYDTMLGKIFANGTDLSLGEYQRLALARAIYREAQLLILDEPTSFMDSWAETRWLEKFRKLAKTRTALIITHRFTTAMLADTIHVMDNGKIIESGTHQSLIASGGSYAESWKAQIEQSRGCP